MIIIKSDDDGNDDDSNDNSNGDLYGVTNMLEKNLFYWSCGKLWKIWSTVYTLKLKSFPHFMAQRSLSNFNSTLEGHEKKNKSLKYLRLPIGV